jgi:hypothetical protein
MVSLDDAKAELQARVNGKQQRVAPETKPQASGGYSKEYLQKAADPNRFGRYMISVEKAQELLNNMQEGVAEDSDTAEDYRAKAQWLRSELHLSPDEAWERAYDTDPETWVGSPWEDDYKQGMAEGYETTPFGGVTNTTPNYSQAWKVTDEGEEFLRKAYQRLKRAYKEGGQVEMINIGPALSELQQQKFGPAYVQQSGPYQMMTTDISRLIEKIEPWQKQYNQQHIATDFDPEDFSNWNKQQGMSENTGRKVDAKGRTQSEWMQLVKQKFPDAKIVQAKMIDGPAHAMLPDGRKFSWTPVQGVAEVGQNFRRGNAQRAALNAMSPEERKAYEEKRAEQQRKRDEARLERERQRNAAKKGVAEAPGAETLAHNQSTVASNEKAFDLEEGKPREKEADYGADYQDMVARVKKLAGLGPLKTVYDPQKRVYKNVPRAEQPKK